MLGGIAGRAVDPEAMDRIRRLGMTPRQQRLNQLWGWYTALQYETRRTDWDGRPHADPVDREAIATAGFLPPGFYDAGGQTLPIKYRRPSAPYHLVRVIVDRMTGLLFSERRHPYVRVDGDTLTEDYLAALIDVSRLWAAALQARSYGGAMGSVAMGFQFVDGKPVVEVHDPRWLFPEFADRAALKLARIEKRYQFPLEVRDYKTGLWVEVPHWYRRVIDAERDVLYAPVPVGDGDEPDWDEYVEREVTHGFGFCPVVWIQNTPVQDEIDGDPDAHGTYEMIEVIDALMAQANLGVTMNCDPTLAIVTEAELGSITKGSSSAIKLPPGSSVNYLELGGSGPRAAVELAERLRAMVLEVAQVVLDHPNTASRTATEIERVYSSMLAKADVLREQYGERGVKPLLEMMVSAAKRVQTPRVVVLDDGREIVQRGAVVLPDRVMRVGGSVERSARQLGPGGLLRLQWRGYFEPGIQDAQQAAAAAATAKAAGLLDDEHAVSFAAEFFRVDDPAKMLDAIRSQQTRQQADLDVMAMGASAVPSRDGPLDPGGATEPEVTYEEPGAQAPPEEPVKFFQYELEGGLVTINEWRVAKGLPPWPPERGDLTLPEYRSKFREVFAAATLTGAAGSAEKIMGLEDEEQL